MSDPGPRPGESKPHGALRPVGGGSGDGLDDVTTERLIEVLLARLTAGEELTGEKGAVLSMALDTATTFLPDNRFSLVFLRNLYQSYRVAGGRYLDPRDQVFLELGVGALNPLSVGMLHILSGGAEQPERVDVAVRGLFWVAVWMLMDPSVFSAPHAMGPTREDVLARLEGFDLGKLYTGNPEGIDSGRLALQTGDAADVDVEDASVDFVASNSFLEHVDDLDAVLAEMARVTKPGGLGLHGVDFRDHRFYRDRALSPLEFLTEREGDEIVRGTNRMRLGELRERFESSGFVVLDTVIIDRVVVDDTLRRRLVPPFDTMSDEDLQCVDARLFVRRR